MQGSGGSLHIDTRSHLLELDGFLRNTGAFIPFPDLHAHVFTMRRPDLERAPAPAGQHSRAHVQRRVAVLQGHADEDNCDASPGRGHLVQPRLSCRLQQVTVSTFTHSPPCPLSPVAVSCPLSQLTESPSTLQSLKRFKPKSAQILPLRRRPSYKYTTTCCARVPCLPASPQRQPSLPPSSRWPRAKNMQRHLPWRFRTPWPSSARCVHSQGFLRDLWCQVGRFMKWRGSALPYRKPFDAPLHRLTLHDCVISCFLTRLCPRAVF